MTRKRRSKITTSKVDYMPAELIEQILLKLPVKSLIRFSTASKLWNSIIFGPEFAQSYRGREMIVFKSVRRYPTNISCWALPLSSISSDNPAADETTPFNFPPGSSYLSSCDSLWCLEFKKSLLLYNPSIRTCQKLPTPPSLNRRYIKPVYYVHGLGYDSVCDDYKILRIPSMSYESYYSEIGTEMYSLRSDCWRRIEPHSLKGRHFVSNEGLFVSGALHWLVARTLGYNEGNKNKLILSFDLSEEKFGLMELPEELALPKPGSRYQLDTIVFGGKLRVYLCYDDSHISVWVMEDYDSKVWMKEMEFDYGHMFSIRNSGLRLRPFYFYDGLGNLVRALALNDKREKMFIYKQENGSPSTPTLLKKNFGSHVSHLVNSFTYVESLICFPKEDDGSMAADVDDESMAAALGRWRIDK